jgi:hypothetical protein
MSLMWDTAQDRIWFARWDDSDTGLCLYAVVEALPDCRDWDWAVWLSDEPKLTKRGTARSPVEASIAASVAAEDCLRETSKSLKGL